MLTTARAIAEGETLDTDVCIVGAGAAGIALARDLGRSGVRCVLLEAGGPRGEAGSQRLYAGHTDDPDRHLPPDRDRLRGLGGTTAIWGGRCMPYDPVDFAPRADGLGWPIGLDALDPWYRAAQALVDCGPWAYDAEAAGLGGSLIEGFADGALTTTTLERWSPPTHFGRAFRDDLAGLATLTTVTGAVAVGLETDSTGGRVERVRVRGLDGRRFRVRARHHVLAGGGLESARLLLATGRERPRAIGDHSGWLGRGYMCHVGGVVARLVFEPGARVIFGYERDPGGVYVRRRLRLSDAVARAEGLPNMYGLLDRPLLDDAAHNSALLSLAWLAKQVVQRQSGTGGGGRLGLYARHLRNLFTGAPEVLTVLPRFGRDRFLSGRRVPSLLLAGDGRSFHFYFHAEQAPRRESAVTLGPGADRLGMPPLAIAFRVAEDDVEGIHRAHLAIDAALRRWGGGRLEFLSPDPRAAIRACKATLGHHIGTTRMAADPANGVVDADARVHGMENLHIASAGVLPTSSQAHPTLTVLALALRLAAHLRSRLADTTARAA